MYPGATKQLEQQLLVYYLIKRTHIVTVTEQMDRVLGLGVHARMSDGVKAAILEEAVQTSYEKAGRESCPISANLNENYTKSEYFRRFIK